MSKLFEEFQDYLNKMNQYEHVITLLYWDMKTVTPKMGQAGHVDALTHFSSEHFAMSTSERLGWPDWQSQWNLKSSRIPGNILSNI